MPAKVKITSCQKIVKQGPLLYARYRWILTFLGFATLWLLILCNPLNNVAGFDQEDDHTLAGLHRDFNTGQSVVEQMKLELRSDEGMRFRPLWVIARVGLAALFGTTWPLYSIYHALLAAIASTFLFQVGRSLNFRGFACLALAVLPFLGQQLQGYIWRAPQEPLAVVFTAISLYIITWSALTAKRQWLWLALFTLAAWGFSFTKESFVLLYPALWFWRVIVLVIWQGQALAAALKKSAWWLLLLSALCALNLGLVILNAGTGSGYLGVEAPGASSYQKYAASALTLLLTPDGVAFVLVLFLFACIPPTGEIRPRPLYTALLLLLFGLAWVIPQIVIVAKSGFYPRYLLPAVIGLWLSIAAAYDRSRQTSRTASRQITVILSLTFLLCGYMAYVYMKFLGEWRQGWTDVVADVQVRTNPQSKILVIADPSDDYGYGKNMYDFLTGYLNLPGENIAIHFNPPPPYNPDPDSRQHKIGVLSPLYRNNVVEDPSSISEFDLVTVPLYQVQKQGFYEKYGSVLSPFENTTGTRHVHFYRRSQMTDG